MPNKNTHNNTPSQHNTKIAGLILAAGRSTRMGQPKALLPWPHNTDGANKAMIASVFDDMKILCEAGIVVTVGDEHMGIAKALGERNYRAIQVDPFAQMINSIVAGLDFICSVLDGSVSGVLMTPVDHPYIIASVVSHLIDLHKTQSGMVLIPTCAGKGGHPILIPLTIARDILTWSLTGSEGLRGYWKEHPHIIKRVEYNEPRIIIDLDTPDDYNSQITQGSHE